MGATLLSVLLLSATLADDDHGGCLPAVGFATDSRLWPMAHTGYVPGAMPYPTNSWYKHSYLAYRGDYFLNGYDYQRRFNYPWHHSHGPCQGICADRGGSPPAEAIPAPTPQHTLAPAADRSLLRKGVGTGDAARASNEVAARQKKTLEALHRYHTADKAPLHNELE